MKKQTLVVAILSILGAFGPPTALAQLPGGIKIPRIGRPKTTPTPAPTPNETSQPAPPAESQPAAQAQPVVTPDARTQPQAAAGQGGLAVLKNQVWVNTRRVTSYKGDGSTYSWTPVIMFDTNGPIPSGAQYHAAVSLPTGSPWVEMDCEWIRGDYYYRCGGPNFPEEKGTTATGLFPFTIKMRNELKGIDQTLFTGKVKIEKAPNEEGTPTERAKRSFFYPVHDWALPIGYVYYGPEDNYLYTSFWVRGATYNIKPHIFYKGKELDYGGNDKSSCNDRIGVGDSYIRTVKPAPTWSLVECRLYTLIVRDKGNRDDTRHRLMSNPGDYEIKVLWNDELARSIKFSVGPDGNFAGGAPLLYKIDGRSDERMPGIMVPVQIIGEQDGPWNKASWKTDAFYGNPPAGLAPAP
jgi:hypothetical protein